MYEFTHSAEHADVAVIVVTYNSAAHLAPLIASLRGEAAQLRVRLIIADNDSADETVALARAHADVIVVRTGGNLGYAGGVNAAMGFVGDAEHVLVLNPDARVHAGCLAALRRCAHDRGAAIVVPRIVDDDAQTYRSLRREPTLGRTLGDAVIGRFLPGRSARWSEVVTRDADYLTAHPIDWASGAAMLIRRDVATQIGPWDERFFLYSEETDFQRRVRDAGHTVWFTPEAEVHHHEHGSGFSPELSWLIAVNRVRYARKHMTPLRSGLVRAAVATAALLRCAEPGFRTMLGIVTHEERWNDLPRATRTGPATLVHPSPITPATKAAAS